MATTIESVRALALSLPRSYEALVRDRVKFRVGRIVFVAISPDERSMGFGFPKEERAALVASEPHKFHMPVPSDERYHWVRVWLDAIDQAEMEELVVEAWRMVVPKRVAAAYPGPGAGPGPAPARAQAPDPGPSEGRREAEGGEQGGVEGGDLGDAAALDA